jgi:hypothetical protein
MYNQSKGMLKTRLTSSQERANYIIWVKALGLIDFRMRNFIDYKPKFGALKTTGKQLKPFY